MGHAAIAIGSNIDPRRNLPEAVRALAREARLLGVSRVYRTPPVGAPGTPPFSNAAALIESNLPPDELVDYVLRPIEDDLGRVRTSDPNAPRTIDLDLVIYCDPDDRVVHHVTDEALEHAHVVIPLAEVMPACVATETGAKVSDLARSFTGEKNEFRLQFDLTSELSRIAAEAEQNTVN